MARVTTTRPLPTTTKPSGSIQKTRALTLTVASPTTTRVTTTRPLPTTTKPSGSIQKTRSPTMSSHGFLGHVRKPVSATERKLWSMQPRPVNCRNGKIQTRWTRWLPPMPKREISSRPLNGKRNISKLQTSPKKKPGRPKTDWCSTKPANLTQKSNHGERASAAIHCSFLFLKRSLNAVTVPRPNALNQDCKVTGKQGCSAVKDMPVPVGTGSPHREDSCTIVVQLFSGTSFRRFRRTR